MASKRDSFCPTSPRHPLSDIMEVTRLTQAATALSAILQTNGIRHAFYGSIFPALLSKIPVTDVRTSFPLPRIYLESSHGRVLSSTGNLLHRRGLVKPHPSISSSSGCRCRSRRLRRCPFNFHEQVRIGLIALSPFSHSPRILNFRLHVTYRRPIPAIDVSSSPSVSVDWSLIILFSRLRSCQLGKLVHESLTATQ